MFRMLIIATFLGLLVGTADSAPLGVESETASARVQGRTMWGHRITAVQVVSEAAERGIMVGDVVTRVFVVNGGLDNASTDLGRIAALLKDAPDYRLVEVDLRRPRADGRYSLIKLNLYPGGEAAHLAAKGTDAQRKARAEENALFASRKAAEEQASDVPLWVTLAILYGALMVERSAEEDELRNYALSIEQSQPEEYRRICVQMVAVEVQLDGECTPSTLEFVSGDWCKGTREFVTNECRGLLGAFPRQCP